MCEKLAVVHITELSDGLVVGQFHFCQQHAEAYLHDEEVLSDSLSDPPPDGVESVDPELAQADAGQEGLLQCPVCGITFREIRQTGRLGCPYDYEFFWRQLESVVLRVHGELEHTGKAQPDAHQRSQRRIELIRLRRELREAVQVENYERAGQIRDQIRSIEHPIGPPIEPRMGLRIPPARQRQ